MQKREMYFREFWIKYFLRDNSIQADLIETDWQIGPIHQNLKICNRNETWFGSDDQFVREYVVFSGRWEDVGRFQRTDVNGEVALHLTRELTYGYHQIVDSILMWSF